MSSFVLPANMSRADVTERLFKFLGSLDPRVRWRIAIAPYTKKRSTSANAYLWGVVYPTIIKEAALEGWNADDLHEFFLGEHFGWETIEGFGRRRMKPVRRSSGLSTTEFQDYIAHIQRIMAEKGVYIPDPNEEQVA